MWASSNIETWLRWNIKLDNKLRKKNIPKTVGWIRNEDMKDKSVNCLTTGTSRNDWKGTIKYISIATIHRLILSSDMYPYALYIDFIITMCMYLVTAEVSENRIATCEWKYPFAMVLIAAITFNYSIHWSDQGSSTVSWFDLNIQSKRSPTENIN